MAPPKKLLKDYEREAQREGRCLVHPSAGAARKCYKMRHGPLRTEQYVCHRCDNPKCIRDSHHFLGSCADNVRDAVAKGRHSCFQKPRLGKSGHSHTEEAKRAIAAGSRAAWRDPVSTARRLEAIREAHAARTPEQKAATAKQIWEKRREANLS